MTQDVIVPYNDANLPLVNAIVDGSKDLKVIGRAQNLNDLVSLLEGKLDSQGIQGYGQLSMKTLHLLIALKKDLDRGVFPSQFAADEDSGYTSSSSSWSVNSSAQSGGSGNAGSGGEPWYYLALQGEGANQKLHVVLRYGHGYGGIPDRLWTYSFP